VTGIGLVKAANILWRAISTYETPLSDFVDHADALEASCADLIGAPLGAPVVTPPATWTTAAEQISAADCAALAAAIAAVELRAVPPCPTGTILQPGAPALCTGLGSIEPVGTYDFETSLAPWTAGTHSVADPALYTGGTWLRSTAAPDGHPGATAFAAAPFPASCGEDHVTGVAFLESPVFAVPADRRTLHVAFSHWIATDAGWDGGNVKVSVNGGPFRVVPSDNFTFNPYNATLLILNPSSSTNPLAGQPAWATATRIGRRQGSRRSISTASRRTATRSRCASGWASTAAVGSWAGTSTTCASTAARLTRRPAPARPVSAARRRPSAARSSR
jgi:hypothetical protein